MTPEEKAKRSRHRLLDKAREFQLGTYSSRFVAPLFQRMIRAEAAAKIGPAPAIVNGELKQVRRHVGSCACVTCGKVEPWSGGIQGMHTGHFLASRKNSILFEEANTAPQCSHCNYYRDGEQQLFRKWMIAVRGIETVERLERLKNEVVQFTREELVDKRIKYAARLKAAEETIRLLTPAG